MTELRLHNFSISLDGYAADPRQDVDNRLGVGGELLHEWIFTPEATDTDRRLLDLGTAAIGAAIISPMASVRGPPRACQR